MKHTWRAYPWVISVFSAALIIMVWMNPLKAINEPEETVIKITAQRFHYTPNVITLKRGQPVILEFTSLDFVHGFNIPDLKLRVDLPPGKVTRLRLVPEKNGTYDFLCDNFCGSGHEEMNGKIIVVD